MIPATAAPHPKIDPPAGCTAATFRVIAKQLYHPWQQPVTNRWRMRRCLGHAQNQKTFRAMKQIRERQAKGKLEAVNRYRALTPYLGCGGRWAVPAWIVCDMESGGDWSAYNSETCGGGYHAVGPYQLCSWPVPWPVDSFKDKIAHHKEAAYVWRVCGTSSCGWSY